ncbi:GNAT family N-acetyltransferase [Pseudorhodoferax sp.]|uniref:GNAT family N-acetyltransferase n=1 Tax=Pseudorhodoferax sp. TaxID=1993553 RepID=UPI002DD6B522|nr:GNAT family N-acetyltransferase [Pseudorhodoferax sp.]
MNDITWKDWPARQLQDDVDLRAQWDRLNAERGDLPFMGAHAWGLALAVFGRGNERLLVGEVGAQCVAMLVLEDAGKLRWQTFQPSQMPLGAWVAQAGISVDDLARSVLQRGPMKLALSVSITQIDALFAPRGADESDNRHDDYIDTAWVDLAGTFEDYWAARGKNLRQNMRKQRNKLETEGVRAETLVFREAADVPGAIARYGALEGQGWKAQEGTAILPDNDQGRFYTGLLQGLAAQGEAEIYEYRFDDKPVAVNLCVRRGGTLTILKTTYDESIRAYSPAFLLNQDILEALYAEQKITRLEYYGSLMEWHTRWTDNKRTIYHLTSFRNSMVKRMAESLTGRAATE